MSDNLKVGRKDTAILIRRLLFFVLLLSLAYFYIALNFRGLTSERGMEQAQIGREIARGNGPTTKVIRPAAIYQGQQNDDSNLELEAFNDTYHSPLNPYLYGAVLKIIGGDDFDKYRIKHDKAGQASETVYRLDRVIAGLSMILFFAAIGINYLLISRIFDTKIAGVTALLMALSELFWRFTHTGLPQMLMLVLFSSALFFIYRALEESVENRIAISSVIIAAIFLSLLALSHWLTIWITLGFILFAAFFFRPKGISGLLVIGILGLSCSYFVIKNIEWSGTPGGTAFLSVYGGLTESEEALMRTSDPSEETYRILYNLNSLILNTSASMLLQINQLYNNLGAIIAAPMFFFALLHPFKRETISQFRWVILLMWVFGVLGMSIFGLSDKATDSNQLHILFAPIMTAYGLAFLSILWARIDLPTNSAFKKSGHFVIVVVLSAGPLILTIPRAIRTGLAIGKDTQRPVWPPYLPSALNKKLNNIVAEEGEIIFTDQPWAVAWYADRPAIWLPRKISEFQDIEELAKEQKMNVVGILVSPTSFANNPLYRPAAFGTKEDFAAFFLDGAANSVTNSAPNSKPLSSRSKPLQEITSNYRNVAVLVPYRLTLYTNKVIKN